MQFLPRTSAIYGDGRNILDPADAIPAAARLLTANGAPANLNETIFADNHSPAYVQLILSWAARYTARGSPAVTTDGRPLYEQAPLSPLPPGTARKVITYAGAQLRKPYQFSWGPGGELMIGHHICPAQGPVAGGSASPAGVVHAGLDLARRCGALRVILYAAAQLDKPYQWGATASGASECSGLTMMACRAARMYIPQTSQQQWAFGRRVPASEFMPGDLMFFAGSDGTMTAPGHVGIVLGEGLMIDAQFTGADVRIEPYADAADLVGFTRPGAGP